MQWNNSPRNNRSLWSFIPCYTHCSAFEIQCMSQWRPDTKDGARSCLCSHLGSWGCKLQWRVQQCSFKINVFQSKMIQKRMTDRRTLQLQRSLKSCALCINKKYWMRERETSNLFFFCEYFEMPCWCARLTRNTRTSKALHLVPLNRTRPMQ